MTFRQLSIDVFLDLLVDMPDIEAVQEIDLRIGRIVDERADLLKGQKQPLADWRIEALETLNHDETKLRSERHLIVMRMERKKWSKAVRALWGDEGLEQCLIWFETMGEPEMKQLPLRPKGRM